MKPDTTIYCGKRIGEHATSEVEVTVDGETLPLGPSLRLRDHSPDGFNWGYGGSGPSQLALAILLDFFEDSAKIEPIYQDFKWDFVCGCGNEWQVTGKEIREWLERKSQAE